MFDKWRLVQISKNIEGGESQEIMAFDTEQAMWSKFWYQCDKVGTNPATKILEILCIDPFGGTIRKEVIDNSRFLTAE